MKTVLVLEQSDLDRLRGGETLDLTPQLSLSLLGKIKRVRPTFQTHTRGQMLGEDGHAMSSTELLAHTHIWYNYANSGGNPGYGGVAQEGGVYTSSTGGNAAMNLYTPTVVTNFIIKY